MNATVAIPIEMFFFINGASLLKEVFSTHQGAHAWGVGLPIFGSISPAANTHTIAKEMAGTGQLTHGIRNQRHSQNGGV